MDGAVHPTLLESISAWVLVVTYALSLAYELWRATAKAGASRHDSMGAFVRELWLYLVAAVVIVLLFARRALRRLGRVGRSRCSSFGACRSSTTTRR